MMMVWTWRTGPANPAHSRHAFVMCLEPAIGGTAPHIVMGTPVRLSGLCDANHGRKNPQDKWRKPHGKPPARVGPIFQIGAVSQRSGQRSLNQSDGLKS